jgi:phosphatidylglycerophosphate synthase
MLPVVIVAGGVASRLRPYSEERPKSLMELEPGLTIADFILERFRRAGLSPVYLVTRKEFPEVFRSKLGSSVAILTVDREEFGNLYMTLVVNALSLLAALLFANGQFLPAAAFSYLLGILDGVDGKLARVRGILTKFGHLEHSLDALYEQALYASFALGLALHGYGLLAAALGMALLLVDCFVRHIYNQFALTAGKPLKHYTPFDRIFAFVDGRRNVYLIYAVAFSAAGHPLLALLAALAHASLTAIVYFLRAACHLRELDEREGTAQLMRLSTHSRKR